MADRDVHFLNPRGTSRGNAQAKVARGSHLASRFTRQPDDDDIALASRLNGAQDIPAVAAGGDCQQDVARSGVSRELAGKHLFISVIVSNRGEGRRVGVQGDGPEGAPLAEETARKFRSDVLRIGG